MYIIDLVKVFWSISIYVLCYSCMDDVNCDVHNIMKIWSCSYKSVIDGYYVLSCITQRKTPTDMTKIAMKMTAARTVVTSRTTLEMKA